MNCALADPLRSLSITILKGQPLVEALCISALLLFFFLSPVSDYIFGNGSMHLLLPCVALTGQGLGFGFPICSSFLRIFFSPNKICLAGRKNYTSFLFFKIKRQRFPPAFFNL